MCRYEGFSSPEVHCNSLAAKELFGQPFRCYPAHEVSLESLKKSDQTAYAGQGWTRSSIFLLTIQPHFLSVGHSLGGEEEEA